MLADLAFGVSMILAVGVGSRLVALGVRTRQLPELVFGGATLSQCLAGVGFATLPALLPEDAIWLGASLALLLEAAGTVAVGIGCWVIFRRGERWALAAAVGLGLTTLLMTTARLLLADPAEATVSQPLGHGAELPLAQTLTNAGVTLAYGWLAVEAARYGLKMRRRLRLGLDRPIVVHQFFLWAVSSTAVVAINLWVIGVVWALGKPSEEIAWAHGTVAAIGLVGTVALWSSFFPPRFYRAWAERGAEATA